MEFTLTDKADSNLPEVTGSVSTECRSIAITLNGFTDLYSADSEGVVAVLEK